MRRVLSSAHKLTLPQWNRPFRNYVKNQGDMLILGVTDNFDNNEKAVDVN